MAPNELSELGPIAATLNKESDDVNTLIAALNEELGSLNFGISIWLPSPANSDPCSTIGFADITDSISFTDIIDSESEYETKRIKQSPRKWQLAVRSYVDDDPDPDGPQFVERPLLKASRNLRVEGLREVPTILRMLKEEAESRISAIRHAKQLVAELSADRKAKF